MTVTDSVYDSLPTAPDGDLVIWRYLPGEYFLPMFERFSDQAAWVEPNPDIAYAVMESDLRDRPSLGIYWSYDASMPLNSELAQ